LKGSVEICRGGEYLKYLYREKPEKKARAGEPRGSLGGEWGYLERQQADQAVWERV